MIKIKLSIDPTKEVQVEALNLLLIAIGQSQGVAQTRTNDPHGYYAGKTATETVEEKPAETKAPKTTKIVPPQKPAEEPKQPNLDHPMETKDADDDEPTATLEEIRENLGKKVTDHRDAIKGKLTEFGAKNVSVLSTEHYTAFNNFLISL